MRVCGIEIKGSEAIICLLSLEQELFQIPECRARKVMLEDINTAEGLQRLQFTFDKLMSDYQINHVIIRQRPMKGKFAGGAVGFKIEAAIQLITNINTEIMVSTEIKELIKRNPLPIEFGGMGLKGFQEPAFNTAYAWLMKQKYQSED